MYNIKNSLITSQFMHCPNMIIQKIIQESFNPRVREVCHIFKKLFDSNYINFIIRNLDTNTLIDRTIKELLIKKDDSCPNSNSFINLRDFFFGIRNHDPKLLSAEEEEKSSEGDSTDDSTEYEDGEFRYLPILPTSRKNFNYILQYKDSFPYDLFPYSMAVKLSEIIKELREGVKDTNLVQMAITDDDEDTFFNFGLEEILHEIRKNQQVKWGPELVKEVSCYLRESTKPENLGSPNEDIRLANETFAFQGRSYQGRSWSYCGTIFYIPEEMLRLTGVQSINLSNNSLFYIPEGFSEFANLTNFDLSNNYIKEFTIDFSGLKNLVSLNISNNKIKKLPDPIARPEKLIEFFADHNEIEKLPEKFGNLESLTKISLNGNKLSVLPKSFSELKNLKDLYLGQNLFSFFPYCLITLTALKCLNFFDNQFDKLPDNFGNLKSLTTLVLNKNKLSALPESFSKLKNLKDLYLSQNLFSIFPDSLLKLTALKCLNFFDNQFDKLPDNFGNLKSLTTLGLNKNKLSALPESFSKLKNLKDLYLGQNLFSIFPDYLFKLTALKCLNFSNNKLGKLPEQIDSLQKLEELDISYNKVSVLPSSLTHLTQLTDLRAWGNCESLDSPDGILEKLSFSLPKLNGSSKAFFKPPVIKAPPTKRQRDPSDSGEGTPPSKVRRNSK